MERLIFKGLLLFFCFISFSIFGQKKEEIQVQLAVNRLFEGMKNADSAMVSNAFSSGAILETIGKNKLGETLVKSENVQDFAQFIGKQKIGAADERIKFETIKMDGDLALVWTPYQFYFQGKYSHSGVNLFCLIRLNNQWKIHYLIDTRRK